MGRREKREFFSRGHFCPLLFPWHGIFKTTYKQFSEHTDVPLSAELVLRVLFSSGYLGGSDGKESVFNVGDLGSIPGLGKSPGRHGNLLQYSCLENPHGQRSLAGPWGCRESDMTE